MQQNFVAATLDTYAARITSGVAYLGGLLMVPLLFAYLSNLRWNGLLIPVAFALVLALFLLLAYGAQPLEYSLDKTHLLIRRRWMRTVRIPLSKINGVSFATMLADVPQKGLRFAFNPGVFGYQGPFYLAPYGEAFFLATNREKLIAVAREANVPLIVSPEHPRDFIAAFTQQINQSNEEAASNGA